MKNKNTIITIGIILLVASIVGFAITYSNGTEEKIPILGDLNEDGCINDIDTSLLLGKMDLTSADEGYMDSYDLNNDGVIDSIDFSTIADNLGEGCEINTDIEFCTAEEYLTYFDTFNDFDLFVTELSDICTESKDRLSCTETPTISFTGEIIPYLGLDAIFIECNIQCDGYGRIMFGDWFYIDSEVRILPTQPEVISSFCN